MPDEQPDPLVPHDVDLTDFKFMPLEVSRLLQSEWWLTAGAEDPRRAYAAVNLWARSWHQRPAASLPDNDVFLAKMADVPLQVWREIRDAVLAPWVKCNDGRWYHPVVAEKANAAWVEKLAYQERKRRWKEAGQKGGQKRAEATLQATPQATLEAGVEATLEATLEAKEERVKRKSKGKDKGLTDKTDTLSTADAADPTSQGHIYPAEFEVWWQHYPRKEGKGAALRAFQAAKKLVPLTALVAGAKAYARRVEGSETRFIKQPATWLNQHCWNDEAPSEPAKRYPKIAGYVPMGNGG